MTSSTSKGQRSPDGQRAALRRATLGVMAAAAGLEVILFAQTAAPPSTPGVQDVVLSIAGALLPGARIRPSAGAPTPAPGGSPPVAVSRPS